MANNTTSLFFLLIIFTVVTLPPYHESAFDFFKLVQQWPPTFCELHGCAQPIIKTFTIHGLWPDNYTTTLGLCTGRKFWSFKDTAFIQNLTVRWPNLKDPSNSEPFWLYEWKKHGTCSENLYPQEAYFKLAMQLYDRLNLLEVLAKSNINPGAISNHLLSQVNNSLVAYTGKVLDFRCQLNQRTPPRNLLKEVVSCYNPSGSAIDCPVSQRSNSCNTHRIIEEGSATTRPPLLKNDNYSYWKNRIRNFLRQDTHVWYVVENGPIIPMKDGPDGTKIPKGILEMNAHEAHLFSMDDKAKNIISCGLDMNQYNRVSACETAKEMWRLLEVTHKGTNQVKETKINMLVQQYEAFKMKEHESINEMYSRFTLIINGLKLLGKTYPEKEVVRKVLRSLPKRWEVKLIVIQEPKDLNVLKLEELVGSLMTHESRSRSMTRKKPPLRRRT
ncbi:hypothetical protein RJ640_021822 [Escallonia rubra]|uniref:Uncharacterized protein n=1 Tax=Escallonia rubra TaxID=112253 RepID=A0AA88RBJ0_9ASTE|nr:hypothetical protein RJ640_021822 [Escallonia rubra]